MKRFYQTLAVGLVAVTFMAVAKIPKPNSETQVSAGIEERTPPVSTLVHLASTDKDLLIPRITTVQRDAIVNPLEGLKIFNTDAGALQIFSNASGSPKWKSILPPGANGGC